MHIKSVCLCSRVSHHAVGFAYKPPAFDWIAKDNAKRNLYIHIHIHTIHQYIRHLIDMYKSHART